MSWMFLKKDLKLFEDSWNYVDNKYVKLDNPSDIMLYKWRHEDCHSKLSEP